MSSTFSLGFGDAVEKWCAKTTKAMEFVFYESVVDAVKFMQRIGPSTAYPNAQWHNPVDTGWHQNSITVSYDAMPVIDPNSEPPDWAMPGAGLHLVKWDSEKTFSEIRAAEIGDTLYIGYTAAYSEFLEHRGGRSSLFVGITALKWPDIVEQNISAHRHS